MIFLIRNLLTVAALSLLMSCGIWQRAAQVDLPPGRGESLGGVYIVGAPEMTILNGAGPTAQVQGAQGQVTAGGAEAGEGGWQFQPEFFLWPVNLLRTPLGLIGAAYTQIIEWLHWGWIFIVDKGIEGFTAFIGLIIWIISLPAFLFLSNDQQAAYARFLFTRMPKAVGNFFMLPFVILEFPLYLYRWLGDPPPPPESATGPVQAHVFHYVPLWRNAQWHWAWDYKLYPPFFFWPEDTQADAE